MPAAARLLPSVTTLLEKELPERQVHRRGARRQNHNTPPKQQQQPQSNKRRAQGDVSHLQTPESRPQSVKRQMAAKEERVASPQVSFFERMLKAVTPSFSKSNENINNNSSAADEEPWYSFSKKVCYQHKDIPLMIPT